jgi:hypothetical protein
MLNGKGVMGVGRTPKGDSKVGASKVDGTEAKESPRGGVMEGGSSGGGMGAMHLQRLESPLLNKLGMGRGGEFLCNWCRKWE